MRYSFFKVSAAIYCDVERENSHVLVEEWVFLVAGNKNILILTIGSH
jgi:hypothetical protein